MVQLNEHVPSYEHVTYCDRLNWTFCNDTKNDECTIIGISERSIMTNEAVESYNLVE